MERRSVDREWLEEQTKTRQTQCIFECKQMKRQGNPTKQMTGRGNPNRKGLCLDCGLCLDGEARIRAKMTKNGFSTARLTTVSQRDSHCFIHHFQAPPAQSRSCAKVDGNRGTHDERWETVTSKLCGKNGGAVKKGHWHVNNMGGIRVPLHENL